MKAFISYSVNDNDQFILTLLSSKLWEKNFIVLTSRNFYNNKIDYGTQNEIVESHLFIGILTGLGIEKDRVLEEWKFATTRNIPTILLIEDTVNVSSHFLGPYIRFNRYNPQNAIDEINQRMTPQPNRTTEPDDIVPWILGGAALIAILALLAKK